MTPDGNELLSAKQIAAIWGRRGTWVYAMQNDGLEMVGGRVTVSAVVAHLKAHPHPRRRSAFWEKRGARASA